MRNSIFCHYDSLFKNYRNLLGLIMAKLGYDIETTLNFERAAGEV
jgi:hypothetical protein